jgi:hypothetical protein
MRPLDFGELSDATQSYTLYRIDDVCLAQLRSQIIDLFFKNELG